MILTQVKVEFSIISEELSLRHLRANLGFEGDSSGDKDDVLKNRKTRGESFIELYTGYEYSLDISEQYSKLIVRIESLKKNIKRELEKGAISCHFCIVVKIVNGDVPAMYLNKELINLLHELQAEIDFDIYADPY